MSLLNTKPKYFQTAVATKSGWANPVTGELLVSIGNLVQKLELEAVKAQNVLPVVMVTVPVEPAQEVEQPTQPEIVEIQEEIVMTEPEIKTRKPYAPRKPKVIGETTETSLQPNQQLLGEVVEYNLDTKVIAE